MSRAATTSDVFNAVAEPRRREIIRLLASGTPRSVGELVEAMDLAQPAVSKHLSVLKEVGLVSVQKDGKNRLYTLNPAELKPVHDWVQPFEQFWSHQLDRVKERAERKAAERAAKN
ncbi:ArsR/SmtB family transcription factor [Anatilimnocola sp. NA78]|uniref:ArsR/SmtB family transcription factor n=1 Tax=Anatilimnocola sp. NA78 TaxID=3415683 RepID=UPI003CE452F5